MTNNLFYDLPVEIINKIYIKDKTYREIYDRVICIIKNFPFFDKVENNYFIFLKEYNFGSTRILHKSLRVSQKYSFKKAVFIIIQKMSKPNTLNLYYNKTI
jgi:hypothetical protein